MKRLLHVKSRDSKVFQTRKPFFLDCLSIEDLNNRIPETSVTTNQSCVTSQKNVNFIYTHLNRGASLKTCSEFYYETLNMFRSYLKKFGESPYIASILTPLIRVLQKLTRFQLVPKLPAFYETRKFNTAFKRTNQLSLLLQKLDKKESNTNGQTERCDVT